MAHDHDHSHGVEGVSDGVLLWSVIINVGLSVFEFIAGAISGSVALMADALHNTNDAAALLIAYAARRISRKGADKKYTFGYRRAELIGAMIQLTALILVGLYLICEAVRRFFVPEPLLGGWIMAAAGVALIVDVVTAWLLWAMSKGSLNVRAAFLHNLTDAGASVAVLLGGAAILWFDWTWVDPVLTLIIAGYILYMSLGLLRKTAHILMEGTPPGLSVDEVKSVIEEMEGVDNVHHLHVWELDENHIALEAHVRTGGARQSYSRLRKQIKDLLKNRFAISHSTLELEDSADGQRCGNEDLIHSQG
jgi:cobalt-zinc-cadmium efflux system protein